MKKNFLILMLLVLMSAGCAAKNNVSNNVDNSLQTTDTSASQTEGTNQVVNEAQVSETAPVSEVATSTENNISNNENKMDNIKEIKQVLMKTNKGDIKIELDWENAPISTENFLKYVQSGFYNGTLFHRVIPGFMIQGGGFDEKGNEKITSEAIKNEAKNGLKNDRGTLAMARTMVVDSATSQFFINLVDNSFLNYRDERNYGYAVFGKVIAGMEIVDAIAAVPTGDKGMYQNWPLDNVVIESVGFIKSE